MFKIRLTKFLSKFRAEPMPPVPHNFPVVSKYHPPRKGQAADAKPSFLRPVYIPLRLRLRK